MSSLLLAFFLNLSVADCATCAVHDDKVLLCADHAREELIAIKRERLRFEKAQTEEEKCAALDALAAITATHANAPSPAVPKALALGLLDSSEVVTAKALALLAPPQNPRACMEALLDARKDLDGQWKTAMEAERKRLGGNSKKLDKASKDLKDGSASQKELEKALKAVLQSGTNKELLPLNRRRQALDRALARYPDERVVRVLTDDLALYEARTATLVTLGSRDALDKVARILEDHREFIKTSEPRPDGSVDPEPHPGAELVAALQALAARHGLAPVPENELRSSTAWSTWLATNRSTFPAKLPGVGAVPDAAR